MVTLLLFFTNLYFPSLGPAWFIIAFSDHILRWALHLVFFPGQQWWLVCWALVSLKVPSEIRPRVGGRRLREGRWIEGLLWQRWIPSKLYLVYSLGDFQVLLDKGGPSCVPTEMDMFSKAGSKINKLGYRCLNQIFISIVVTWVTIVECTQTKFHCHWGN